MIYGYGLDPYPPFDEGLKNFVLPLMNQLKKNFDVIIFSSTPNISQQFKHERINGIEYFLIKHSPLSSLLRIYIFLSIVLLRKIKIIHFMGLPSSLMSKLLPNKVKQLTTLYEYSATKLKPFNYKTTFVVESNRMKNELLRKGIVCKLIYPGIELSKFRVKQYDKKTCGRGIFMSSPLPRHNNPELENKYINKRGLSHILKISAILNSKTPFRTTLLWRKNTNHIRKLTKNNTSIIVTEKNITNMDQYLMNFGFCFVPTGDLAKEIPMSLVECLAKGIPLIVSNTMPLAKLVKEHNFGIVFDNNNLELATNEIHSVINNKQKYIKLSKNAHTFSKNYFDIKKTVNEYTKIYSK